MSNPSHPTTSSYFPNIVTAPTNYLVSLCEYFKFTPIMGTFVEMIGYSVSRQLFTYDRKWMILSF